MTHWSPYRPPWYPNRDPLHNPWLRDPLSGHTAYARWEAKLDPGELERLIAKHREGE